jgi:hypothetical protein
MRSADLVAALSRPGAFPDPASRVEMVETHMSWVFLTETHAYKLKKPVRYGLGDQGLRAAETRAPPDAGACLAGRGWSGGRGRAVVQAGPSPGGEPCWN